MKTAEKNIFDEINITPLTDIFLVLLIIMMVVAPMLEYRGLNVALMAPAVADESRDEPKKTRVEIDAQGTYRVAGETIPAEGLTAAIRADAATHPDGLIIESNAEATLEAMIRVMDAARIAGVAKVSIMESPSPTAAPPPPPRKTTSP